MVAQKILFPYNFTAHEEKALDFIINVFVRHKDAKVTLFNAYTPMPQLDLQANPELGKMKSAVVSLSNELKEKEEGLKSARQYLIENGFAESQVEYVLKERSLPVPDEIIDIVSKGHYRIVVLSRQPGKASRLFSRNIHNKVLSALNDVTVCIAI